MKMMKRLVPVILLLAAAGTVMAAVYTYKCPKCGLILQFEHMGFYKCPRDGWVMIKV